MPKSNYLQNLLKQLKTRIENQDEIQTGIKSIRSKSKKNIREKLRSVVKDSSDIDRFISSVKKEDQDKYFDGFIETVKNLKNLSLTDLEGLWHLFVDKTSDVRSRNVEQPTQEQWNNIIRSRYNEMLKRDEKIKDRQQTELEYEKAEEINKALREKNIRQTAKYEYTPITGHLRYKDGPNAGEVIKPATDIRSMENSLERYNEKYKNFPGFVASGMSNKGLINKFNVIRGELQINNSASLHNEAKMILKEMLNRKIITQKQFNEIF